MHRHYKTLLFGSNKYIPNYLLLRDNETARGVERGMDLEIGSFGDILLILMDISAFRLNRYIYIICFSAMLLEHNG